MVFKVSLIAEYLLRGVLYDGSARSKLRMMMHLKLTLCLRIEPSPFSWVCRMPVSLRLDRDERVLVTVDW
jgi:hypothetical protein